MYAFVDVYLFMSVNIENAKKEEERDAKKEIL